MQVKLLCLPEILKSFQPKPFHCVWNICFFFQILVKQAYVCTLVFYFVWTSVWNYSHPKYELYKRFVFETFNNFFIKLFLLFCFFDGLYQCSDKFSWQRLRFLIHYSCSGKEQNHYGHVRPRPNDGNEMTLFTIGEGRPTKPNVPLNLYNINKN